MQNVTKTRTIKKITLNSYSDPGHGWLKVDRKILVALGIDKDITGFSYERNNDVFLEEDCDAPRLIQALQARGVEVKFRHSSTRSKQSKIRSYFSYRPR